VKNSNLRLFLRHHAIFGEDRAAVLLCIFYFQNECCPPSWIFIFWQFLWKFKFAPISTLLCKIWWRSDYPQPSYCVYL